MPTLDEMLRREQDLFRQERRDEAEPTSAHAVAEAQAQQQQAQAQLEAQALALARPTESERRDAAKLELLAQKTVGEAPSELERPVEKEAMAPHLLAEVPQQTEVPHDTMLRLFEHYAEQDGDDEDVTQRPTGQIDPRQAARELLPRKVDVGDVILDGMEGDFVHDSAIVGADLDTHPTPGAGDKGDALWDGWADGRRRRRGDGPFAPAEPAELVTEAPARAPTTDKEPT